MRGILAPVRKPINPRCFSLIYGCGLRISEAAALPVTAIDKTSGVLRVVGKGNKERVVPVPKEVHEGLRRMWQAKDHRDPRWLFPNGWPERPQMALAHRFADAHSHKPRRLVSDAEHAMQLMSAHSLLR